MSALTIALELCLASIGLTVAVGALFVGMNIDEKARAHEAVRLQIAAEERAFDRELVGV